MRGLSTISEIIKTTTEGIWEALQPKFLPTPSEEKWTNIANRYYELWNMPNCVGAIDGKHFRIKCPPKSGSTFFNYKCFFSIVLMASVDADGLFTTVDVGEVGRNSDGAVFRTSGLGRCLESRTLNLPSPKPLPLTDNNENFPFYFVADEAFPLKNNIMRPYPKRILDMKKRIFNFRLSRARKSVECAFGMLVSKFRLFEGPICCKEETINSVIRSACVLHNFIRVHQGIYSRPQMFLNESSANNRELQVQPQQTRATSQAQQLREKLCDYFMTPAGAISYQWNI